MSWSSRGAILSGVILFVCSVVLLVISYTAPAGDGASAAVASPALRATLHAVGLMVTSGLLMVAGAVFAVAERLTPASDRA